MKLFLKKNKIAIVVYIVMVILIGLGVSDYQKENEYQKRLEYQERALKDCEEYDYSTESEIMESVCERIKNEEVKKDDTLTVFLKILGPRVMFLNLILPLLIIACSIKKWHSYMKNGIIKHFLIRKKYSQILKQIFCDCYKYILIFLSFIFLTFIISFIISGHFEYLDLISYVKEEFYDLLPYSLIVMFLNLVINYFIYINIALITTKYNKNYYVCVLMSYLFWLISFLLIDVVIIRFLLMEVFSIPIDKSFNLFDIYFPSSISNMLLQLIIFAIVALLSFIILLFVYRKKERLTIKSQ